MTFAPGSKFLHLSNIRTASYVYNNAGRCVAHFPGVVHAQTKELITGQGINPERAGQQLADNLDKADLTGTLEIQHG